MLEQKLNSEQKDETQLPSSPNNGNTHVVCSQNCQGDCSNSDWLTFVEWAALIGWLVATVLIFS